MCRQERGWWAFVGVQGAGVQGAPQGCGQGSDVISGTHPISPGSFPSWSFLPHSVYPPSTLHPRPGPGEVSHPCSYPAPQGNNRWFYFLA